MYLPIAKETYKRKSRSKRKTAKHKAKQRRRVNRMAGKSLGRRTKKN